MSRLSRRRFLHVGAAVVAALGGGLIIEQQVIPLLLKPQNRYAHGLSIEQKISPEILEHPPVKSSILELGIKIRSTIPPPIERITLRLSGLKGFQLKSARYQGNDLRLPNPGDSEDLVLELTDESLQLGFVGVLQLTYEGGWSSETSDIVTQVIGEYFNEGTFGFGTGYLQTVSNQVQTSVRVIPLPKVFKKLSQQGRNDWFQEILNRRILLQYPVPAELQEKYWRDPNEWNGEEVIEYFYSELEKAEAPFPELVNELHKLPDLQNPKYDVNLVKAFENIASICLLYGTPKENIERLLDEGIKDKRKYCTPLQALLWLGKKELLDKNNNPLEDYSVRSLLTRAWNFDTDDWRDFKVVTERLNSPEVVSRYMFLRISYGFYAPAPRGVETAAKVFHLNGGACSEQVSFFIHCLNSNGYYARPLEIRRLLHTISLFRDKDGRFYTHDNTIREHTGENTIQGPFGSAEADAVKYAREFTIASWPFEGATGRFRK